MIWFLAGYFNAWVFAFQVHAFLSAILKSSNLRDQIFSQVFWHKLMWSQNLFIISLFHMVWIFMYLVIELLTCLRMGYVLRTCRGFSSHIVYAWYYLSKIQKCSEIQQAPRVSEMGLWTSLIEWALDLELDGVDLQGSSHNGALHDPGWVPLLPDLQFSYLWNVPFLSQKHCRLGDHSLLELCVKKELNRFWMRFEGLLSKGQEFYCNCVLAILCLSH